MRQKKTEAEQENGSGRQHVHFLNQLNKVEGNSSLGHVGGSWRCIVPPSVFLPAYQRVQAKTLRRKETTNSQNYVYRGQVIPPTQGLGHSGNVLCWNASWDYPLWQQDRLIFMVGQQAVWNISDESLHSPSCPSSLILPRKMNSDSKTS